MFVVIGIALSALKILFNQTIVAVVAKLRFIATSAHIMKKWRNAKENVGSLYATIASVT